MRHQKISQEGLSSCRCSTTSHGDQETMKKNASQMLDSFLSMQEVLEQDSGPGSEKKWYSISADSPQGEWDRMAEKMMLTRRVALDWLFERINLDPKIQIKYIDTKNQLADILTKGNFTRDEWNNLLCLFNIGQFSSTNCSEVMSKRTQKDSDEERVTAKSRPMMNLVSRCSERTPDVLASTASESPGQTRHESRFTSELME